MKTLSQTLRNLPSSFLSATINWAPVVYRICGITWSSLQKHAAHIHSRYRASNTPEIQSLQTPLPFFARCLLHNLYRVLIHLIYFATAGLISPSQHSLSLSLRSCHLIFGPFLLLPAEVPISAICGSICQASMEDRARPGGCSVTEGVAEKSQISHSEDRFTPTLVLNAPRLLRTPGELNWGPPELPCPNLKPCHI